ncbi:MAG: stage II sporulation protein E (SpoIIE) [Gemmatimonadetes bacterium]|nr:MAG: stage II sporulation protein E (SpoIIE) [Gemmatimonadota bacterium]
MHEAPADAATLLDWGVAAVALPGEPESGDLHLVRSVGGGVLVAVVDGLGHGAEAATAARLAIAALARHAHESPPSLFERTHQALKGTRGVVMSLAFFKRTDPSLTWLGVGNVEGLLVHAVDAARAARARKSLVTRGGIVGSELPRLQAEVLRLTAGDTLIFATDGIREGFVDGLPAGATPQQQAEHILARHGKGTDDALVLVARYRGQSRTGR